MQIRHKVSRMRRNFSRPRAAHRSFRSFAIEHPKRRLVFREGKLEIEITRFRNPSSSARILRLNISKQASCARFFLNIVFSIVFFDYISTRSFITFLFRSDNDDTLSRSYDRFLIISLRVSDYATLTATHRRMFRLEI